MSFQKHVLHPEAVFFCDDYYGNSIVNFNLQFFDRYFALISPLDIHGKSRIINENRIMRSLVESFTGPIVWPLSILPIDAYSGVCVCVRMFYAPISLLCYGLIN